MPSPGWYEGPLESLVTLQRGFDITKKEQQPGPYEVISSSGPNSTHSDFKVAGPGLIIGRKGTLGTVFYSERAFWPHDTTLWVKDFHGNNPKFCYYFLKTMNFERFDCGASNPTLNRNHIHQLLVTYPALALQARIASILSAYDDLIENNTRRIQILEEMAQMIYREWFAHFRFPGHESVKMVESELGPIPEGWGVQTLGDIALITMGQSPPSESYNSAGVGLPFHQGVSDFGARFPSDRTYCTTENRLAYPNDVLMSVRAPVGRLNISLKKIVIGRGLCAIQSKIGTQALLFQQLREYFFEEDTMGSGTIFKAVTKQDVHGIKLIVADAKIAARLESLLSPFFRQLEILSEKNSILRATRDLLLPKLISGDLSVGSVEEAAMEAAV